MDDSKFQLTDMGLEMTKEFVCINARLICSRGDWQVKRKVVVEDNLLVCNHNILGHNLSFHCIRSDRLTSSLAKMIMALRVTGMLNRKPWERF